MPGGFGRRYRAAGVPIEETTMMLFTKNEYRGYEITIEATQEYWGIGYTQKIKEIGNKNTKWTSWGYKYPVDALIDAEQTVNQWEYMRGKDHETA